MSEEYKLSEESAFEQYKKLIDYYDIDPSVVLPTQINMLKNVLVKAIRRGALEIEVNENGIEIKQHITKPPKGLSTPLVYQEVTGRAKQIVSQLGESASTYDQMVTFVAFLTKEEKSLLPDLVSKDHKVMEMMGTLLFLA